MAACSSSRQTMGAFPWRCGPCAYRGGSLRLNTDMKKGRRASIFRKSFTNDKKEIMMAVAEISVVPLGTPGTSLSAHVARVLQVLRKSSLKYELTGMGTIISGDIDEIWKVMREMHESCFSDEVFRVLAIMRVDDRRDRIASPEQKVQSVMGKLMEK